MSDWPNTLLSPLTTITPFSVESLGANAGTVITSIASSGTWPSANVALLYPFKVDVGGTIVKAFLMNGASLAGNVNVGVYDHEFNLLVSAGSTLQAGASAIQEFDVTDTAINPGRYWLAVAATSTSATVYRLSAADELVISVLPILEQASAIPLPSTLTPVKCTLTAVPVVLCGVSFTTTI